MSNLDKDLEFAQALITHEEKFTEYLWHFYRIWPFTTINMKEYLSKFNLKDKKCVSIQGSSDHIFEIFLQKPKKIIGIDTNPLTGHYGYLKIAAFKALSTPEEFLNFFRWKDYPNTYKYNRSSFDKDVFEEISKYLEGDSKSFWEELFRTYDSLQIRTNLFNDVDEENSEALADSLSYITAQNYQYIHQNIDSLDFSFMNTDVRNLVNELKEKQDFITLSNLIIYMDSLFPDYPLKSFRDLIEDLSLLLNDNGEIMAGYLYDIENENDYRSIYKADLRDAIFTGSEYSYNYIKRMHDIHCGRKSNNHDACLIYTKTKKGK